jgi:LmbE family N-acetylglucosaminyl deacetylase
LAGPPVYPRGSRLKALLLTLAAGAAVAAQPAPLPTLAPPGATDRVLVIAPHPDDETLCCAGYLQQALRNGAQVAVVWVTAGDSFEIDAIVTEHTLRPRGAGLERLGTRRIAEAQAAADLLGVPRKQQYMLGYPDRDIHTLTYGPRTVLLRSRYTGVSAVPYAGAFDPGAAYSGAQLRRDLQQVIDRFAPTIVLAAAPQDRHADHSASGALVRELLHASRPRARLYYWIVHAGHRWPSLRGLRAAEPLRPPALAATLGWQQLPLSPAQTALKLQAVRAHRTQLEVMSRFLYGFVRANEIFAAAP